MVEDIAVIAMRLQQENCEERNILELRYPQNQEMDIDEIKRGLSKPGKTQRGLAQAMGIEASAVNRILKGTRQIKASELQAIFAYLAEPNPKPSSADSANTINAASTFRGTIPPPPASMSWEGHIRVLGMAECGPDGWALWNGEVVDYVPRPPNLAGAAAAYAVFAVGSSMEPRYHPGELIYVHPGKPVTVNSYVLVQLKPLEDGSAPRAVLKRLKKRTGNKVILEQFNPEKVFELKDSEIVSMHRVVGSGEA